MIQFVPGQRRDAKRLAVFAEKAYRDTFSAFNTPKNMDAYVHQAFGDDIQLRELSDPKREILLALEDEVLVGYYQIIKCQPEPSVADPAPCELMRLYVDSDYKGKGLAHLLMEAALKNAKSAHAETVWLGVWEKNCRAISFYRKWGFVEVGSHVFHMGDDPQRDLILSKKL